MKRLKALAFIAIKQTAFGPKKLMKAFLLNFRGRVVVATEVLPRPKCPESHPESLRDVGNFVK